MDEVGICNRALAMIGQPAIAALVDDPSTATNKAVMWCSQLYPETVKDLLAAYPWRWASKRVELDEDTVEPPEYGYDYAYYLPQDWLRMADLPDDTVVYSVENGRLLSNLNPFQCRYVFLVDDPDTFPRYFSRLLVAQLASELAFPVAGNEKLGEQFLRLSMMYLGNAKAADATGEQPVNDTDSWITARR